MNFAVSVDHHAGGDNQAVGRLAFLHPFLKHYSKLAGWLQENSAPPKPKATQPALF